MAAVLVAGVLAPFRQFGQEDFSSYNRPEQKWIPAQMLSLKVAGGTSVWLSNYVRSWYEPIADLHGNTFNMQRYGYVTKSAVESGDYEDKIVWSSGQTTDITYVNDTTPHTNTATGYLLDYFGEDTEVFFVATLLEADGGETVDSWQFVHDLGHDTNLYSRQYNTVDLAGNVRVNFGVGPEESGREFVAVFSDTGPVTGQPLPGALLAGVLALGMVLGKGVVHAKAR